MTYSLITYKSSGYTTCMGHTADEWSSQFEIEHGLTEDGLIKTIAVLTADNADPDVLGTWEWHIFEEAQPVSDWQFEAQIAEAAKVETESRRRLAQHAEEQAAARVAEAERQRELKELGRLQEKSGAAK